MPTFLCQSQKGLYCFHPVSHLQSVIGGAQKFIDVVLRNGKVCGNLGIAFTICHHAKKLRLTGRYPDVFMRWSTERTGRLLSKTGEG